MCAVAQDKPAPNPDTIASVSGCPASSEDIVKGIEGELVLPYLYTPSDFCCKISQNPP